MAATGADFAVAAVVDDDTAGVSVVDAVGVTGDDAADDAVVAFAHGVDDGLDVVDLVLASIGTSMQLIHMWTVTAAPWPGCCNTRRWLGLRPKRGPAGELHCHVVHLALQCLRMALERDLSRERSLESFLPSRERDLDLERERVRRDPKNTFSTARVAAFAMSTA